MKQCNIAELVNGLASIDNMVDAVQSVHGGDCYVDESKEFDLHLKDGSVLYFTPQKDNTVRVMLWNSDIDTMNPIWEFNAQIGTRVLVQKDALIEAIRAALALSQGRVNVTDALQRALNEAVK
jgi:hypothetical protein